MKQFLSGRRRLVSLSLLCMLGLLSACGGSSEEEGRVLIDGLGLTVHVDKSGLYDIEISGARNEVSVAATNTVDKLLITGFNNTVRVKAGASIQHIDFSGSGNTVYVPRGFKAKVSKAGANNDVIEV